MLDIIYRFTCGDSDLSEIIEKCQNIMTRIVEGLYSFHPSYYCFELYVYIYYIYIFQQHGQYQFQQYQHQQTNANQGKIDLRTLYGSIQLSAVMLKRT